MKKILLILLMLLLNVKSYAATVWINDARAQFQSNGMVILGVNIRTFNSKDLNKNGIIEERLGEEYGNFQNAINRLDELAMQGVNTIHLLPITPVGKMKAMGTAGSLYALNSFDEINPQLVNKKSKLSAKEQATRFIEECHRRKIRVLLDLPSCASYDYYLKNDALFLKRSGISIIPSDWTDVRVFDAGSEWRINLDLCDKYKSFFDFALELGADGVIASNAYTKPANFWGEIIKHVRAKDPQFLFIAQSTDKEIQIAEKVPVTSYEKLLDVGFDGYYAGYSRFSDWEKAEELYQHVKFNQKLFSKYKVVKSALGSFATIDEVSPVLVNGPQYSIMLAWLNATLPVNAYFVDGFQSGDDYIYPWENKRAEQTFTDDNFYFAHRGKLDIFNFSRKPGAQNGDILQNFILANKFKFMMGQIMQDAMFVPLEVNSANVFAFARSNEKNAVIVIGNMDFSNMQNVKVVVPHLSEKISIVPVKIQDIPEISKNRLNAILAPGEVQVLLVKDFSIK
ncbi:MAG: hypothetical protein ACI37S_07040 [Candidatus Gastranaerophilaceae bacterium]